MAVALPSDNDVAALAMDDFGEDLIVDSAPAVTGTLVYAQPQMSEEAAGTDRRRRANVRLPAGTTVSFRSQILRVADNTTWHVETAPDVEYGGVVCQCVRAQRQSEGRL